MGRVNRHWEKETAALQCTMVHADQRKLDPATVAAVRAAGLSLFAYTVNLAERARELFSWGVDAVFSDCPGQLVP